MQIFNVVFTANITYNNNWYAVSMSLHLHIVLDMYKCIVEKL